MSFLLDTNVVSEPTRRQPEPRVIDWLAAQTDETLFLSALKLGELRRGILLLDEGRKRRGLLRWLEEEIEPGFGGRVVAVDAPVMRAWAELQARAQHGGRALPVMDGLFAASALAHDFTLVTRNASDFAATGVKLLNPWIVE
ncbi:MAG: type II toxin-antitoxin system VapC family toxin [Opitutus sp.]|nr:type II toxin-antitoxin system VapC family toxin [Opitutus sp.]